MELKILLDCIGKYKTRISRLPAVGRN